MCPLNYSTSLLTHRVPPPPPLPLSSQHYSTSLLTLLYICRNLHLHQDREQHHHRTEDGERSVGGAGTRFTRFTGTKVQILTQKAADGGVGAGGGGREGLAEEEEEEEGVGGGAGRGRVGLSANAWPPSLPPERWRDGREVLQVLEKSVYMCVYV